MKGKVIEEPPAEEVETTENKETLEENAGKTVRFDIQPEQEIEKITSGQVNKAISNQERN